MGDETCGILTNDDCITDCGGEALPCLRPNGHYGPHLIKKADGIHVAYQIDQHCDCESCQQYDDSSLWCEVYGEVAPEEAQQFINDPKYVGDWDP